MFNPKDYWKNRKAGKRGQGDEVKGKFTPKGETVKYTNRKGKKADYPNGAGEHMVLGRGIINRKQDRTKLPKLKDTTASDYRKEQRAIKHAKRNDGEHERAVKKF